MPWGNEDDVAETVRRLLKPIRAKHKKEVLRLKDKIAMLEQEIKRLDVAAEHTEYLLKEARVKASYLEFPDTTGGQGLERDFTTGEMGQ